MKFSKYSHHCCEIYDRYLRSVSLCHYFNDLIYLDVKYYSGFFYLHRDTNLSKVTMDIEKAVGRTFNNLDIPAMNDRTNWQIEGV